jgi:hypothetical protein
VSGIAPDLPIWAQWFAALAVPIAAVFGVVIGVFNYFLQWQRRRDDLFDRRFKYYVKLREYYLMNCDDFYYVHPGDRDEIRATIPIEQINLSTEARFLFGEKLAKFVKELHWEDAPRLPLRPKFNINDEPMSPEQREEVWRAERLSYSTPTWFDKPFLKYMALGE